MLGRLLLLLLMIMAFPLYAQSAAENVSAGEGALPVVKLRPQIRVSDMPLYSDLPCEELSLAHPQNDEQEEALSRRKRECLSPYDAFLPKSGMR